jgi:hypothetical protein
MLMATEEVGPVHILMDSKSDQEIPVAVFWIQNDLFAKFIENISRTTTFALLVPKRNYPTFYQILPDLLLFLKSLPSMLIEVGIQDTKLFVTMQLQ